MRIFVKMYLFAQTWSKRAVWLLLVGIQSFVRTYDVVCLRCLAAVNHMAREGFVQIQVICSCPHQGGEPRRKDGCFAIRASCLYLADRETTKYTHWPDSQGTLHSTALRGNSNTLISCIYRTVNGSFVRDPELSKQISGYKWFSSVFLIEAVYNSCL